MRISKKVATASVASAFVLGATLVLPSMAGAQDTTTTSESTTTSSTIPETTTTTVVEPVTTTTAVMLNCTTTPDYSGIVGPLNIPLSMVTEALPSAPAGESIPFTTSYTLTLPTKLQEIATGAGLAQVNVSNFAFTVQASGGVSGGPFSASPTSFDIPVAAPSSYTGTMSDSVTSDGSSGALSIVNPVTMTVVVTMPVVGSITLEAVCNADPATFVSFNGGPPETTTTTGGGNSTTTTAKNGGATGGTPRFTG